jgi:hypothetical protein
MRVRALERILRRHGFTLDHIRGIHRIYRDRAGRRLAAFGERHNCLVWGVSASTVRGG